ncbi:hypothetical protein L249_5112 [Ophiocordyceps polyrhachis-furcata BCC 54312]|uniref:Uncharacterized protein n=1 Tax=Ophiocordyceps polyrhachis-furcata BCC 54312 TaxID=1330021 RepID=A0A367L3C5_9HYPO|nr:hypothetical protein L249_5112 [Ophiocordyceps polyrhachis-furcata BCC 54312]
MLDSGTTIHIFNDITRFFNHRTAEPEVFMNVAYYPHLSRRAIEHQFAGTAFRRHHYGSMMAQNKLHHGFRLRDVWNVQGSDSGL